MNTFRKVTLEDQKLFKTYMRQMHTRSCEYTFANLYLWSKAYHIEVTVVDDMLLARSILDGKASFAFPMGNPERLKSVLDKVMTWCEKEGLAFCMHSITREQFAKIEELYPGEFEVVFSEDTADYIYESEKLAKLSGKKYHGKKNHLNKFMKTYPNWSFEQITEENLEECFQMALNWRTENGCDDDEEKNKEMCVTLNSLRLFKELELEGGMLRVDGKVVAFTMGEPITDDTYDVHIEKAYADINGAYTVINQQFIEHVVAPRFQYVNREEDMGEEGLRKAKQSYRPIFMVEKGVVRKKEEQ